MPTCTKKKERGLQNRTHKDMFLLKLYKSMKNFQKTQIVEKLSDYIGRFDSQNKAANSLKNVSSATLSQMINGKWDLIKDDMWRNVAAQIGWQEEKWIGVETRDYKLLTAFLTDAQKHSMVIAATGEAGTGKTYTLRKYAENNKRVYMLQCAEWWNRKMFLGELLTAMGRDCAGYTVAEMMHEAVRTLKMQDNPLIIIDEADKLTDQVLYFFITLYNQLEDRCGIVLTATDHLTKKVKRGLNLNKKGYKEIYSRIGRKFIELKGLGQADINAVCHANGVTETATINRITKECEGDLRRVKRMVYAELIKETQNAN